MKTIRVAVSLVGALLLGGGYVASQYAYFFGEPSNYARALDGSSVPVLSLVLLVMAVVLAVVPDKEPKG